jgi:hypothetical protein
VTIDELKQQRRWMLWRLEHVNDKVTKVPYQPNGRKAMANNPATWSTYAECETVLSNFHGYGVALGMVDGVRLAGVDIDQCCDAATGKFSPETREIVIGLDSYSEYSPSGTGCHILALMTEPLPGRGIKKTHPGCKAVEVKADGFYFTFTARHIGKTPSTLMHRQEQLTVLYDRLSKTPKSAGLSITVPTSEDERFKKLWAGELDDYNADHSAADFALCILLAKMHGFNAFRVDTEFRKSGLYRDKWERDDYRETTVTRAILAAWRDEPVLSGVNDDDAMDDDDGPTDFLMDGTDPGKDGLFPFGEVNCIGGPSGAGKTAVMLPALERIRLGQSVWGHPVGKPREYRVLLHDRSKKAMARTARSLHLTDETKKRIVRLTRAQQKADPATILYESIQANPGVSVFFIEGLDLWIPNMKAMQDVAPIIDDLQRVAYRANVCIIASVGAPKQKGKDRYFGRDSLFGSSALARKVETVCLMALHDEKDQNSVRHCLVLPRTSRAESLYFTWTDAGFVQTAEPPPVDEASQSAFSRTTQLVYENAKSNEPIVHQQCFGSESTFYRWRKWAVEKQILFQSNGKFFLSPTGVKFGEVSDSDSPKP